METATLELEEKALSVPDRAKTIRISDSKSYVEAGELLKGIKGLRAKIDETFDPICRKAFEAHKEAVGKKKSIEAPLIEAEGLIKSKILEYDAEQERLRLEAQRKLDEEIRAKAEEERLAEAVHLEEIGEVAEAEAILQEPIEVSTVVLPKSTPKIEGQSTRIGYSAEVVNLLELAKGVASGRIPVQAIMANTTFLNGQAKLMKDAFNYPGVRLLKKRILSSR